MNQWMLDRCDDTQQVNLSLHRIKYHAVKTYGGREA